MKQSTRIMMKKHGWRLDRFLHNYIYFVFYYPYVRLVYLLLPFTRHLTWCKPLIPISNMVFSRYHSKVLSKGDTEKIFTLDRNISVISNANKSIVPYKYANKIIFQEPEYIAVMDCPCKKSASAPEDEINSCIAVGKGLASFWLEHCGKYNPRKISQQEALDIIKRFRKKNHITQAFFKVATGGSTGVICNCHPDTCVSLQATMYTSKIDKSLSMNAKAGYSVTHDTEKCRHCGTCESVCNFSMIETVDGRRKYNVGGCMGCELCVENCPEGALTLFVDPNKPLPLDLDKVEHGQMN